MAHRETQSPRPITCLDCGRAGEVEISVNDSPYVTRDDPWIEELSEGFRAVSNGRSGEPIAINCAACNVRVWPR